MHTFLSPWSLFRCGQSVSQLFFSSKVYVTKVYVTNVYISKVHFPKFIFPKLIFPKEYFSKCTWLHASSKLCEFTLKRCPMCWMELFDKVRWMKLVCGQYSDEWLPSLPILLMDCQELLANSDKLSHSRRRRGGGLPKREM